MKKENVVAQMTEEDDGVTESVLRESVILCKIMNEQPPSEAERYSVVALLPKSHRSFETGFTRQVFVNKRYYEIAEKDMTIGQMEAMLSAKNTP